MQIKIKIGGNTLGFNSLKNIPKSELETRKGIFVGDRVYKMVPTFTTRGGDINLFYSVYDTDNDQTTEIGESSEKNYELYDALFGSVELDIINYIGKVIWHTMENIKSGLEYLGSDYYDSPSDAAANLLINGCDMKGEKYKLMIPFLAAINNKNTLFLLNENNIPFNGDDIVSNINVWSNFIKNSPLYKNQEYDRTGVIE